MSLVQLEIVRVRNLEQVQIEPASRINILIGENASGKTSVLEAIHILSLARSFRTNHIQHVIQHGAETLRVVGKVSLQPEAKPVPVGIERGRDQVQIRIQKQTVHKTSELAAILPVQLINPDIHKLLEQGPKYRRQFLDWGVFHVEHQFLSLWQDYHKVLRQRNAALRHESRAENIRYWDALLVARATAISELRQSYISGLGPHLEYYCQQLLGLTPELHYQPGWARDRSLAEQLESGLERDRQIGYTQAGPHRADLVIKHQQVAVQNTFSRGQLKMLVSAMRLAQVAYLKARRGQTPVLLVDDLAAELDPGRRGKLLQLLLESGAQLFVTATEAALLQPPPGEGQKWFHVEHGNLTEVVY